MLQLTRRRAPKRAYRVTGHWCQPINLAVPDSTLAQAAISDLVLRGDQLPGFLDWAECTNSTGFVLVRGQRDAWYALREEMVYAVALRVTRLPIWGTRWHPTEFTINGAEVRWNV